MKSISATKPLEEEFHTLWKRVSEYRGWCQIITLSGELEEGIYMAVFTDDSRTLFEVNEGLLSLLLTADQVNEWENQLTEEERIQILEEILLYYLRGDFKEVEL